MNSQVSTLSVVLVDDHTLFRDGLVNLLKEFEDIHVLFSACHGGEMQHKITQQALPHVVLMDINMPVMDGYSTTLWLKKNYPSIQVLALSMYEDDLSIIKMLRNGAGGYILKECKTEELVKGIRAIAATGYYMNDIVSGRLLHNIRKENETPLNDVPKISSLEMEFLKLSCSELTYKEIANQMGVSPRMVDNYREELFEKRALRSRTGLVLYAIRNNLVSII